MTISEHRGAELEATYGLSDGVDGSLDQFQYAGAGDADLSMRGATVEGTRTGRMRHRRDHIVFWIGDGTATLTPESGETLTAVPGRPMMLSGSVAYDFTADTRKVTMLHVSEALLRRCLAARGVVLRGPLVFDEQPDGIASLRDLQAELRRSTPDLVNAEVTGAERALLDARVADAVVRTFPVRAAPSLASPSVSRAVDLMHLDARSPLTLEDLADASGLSIRGLQNAFSRDLDTTPTKYLRDLRLDGARRELEDGEASAVAEVARDWQFNHLGRFASAYGERFGERPSETLRRRRG
ncbi:helix-turn-helix transcriptional regulator [Curtobacterium sp. VKM Ac-2922]|uniref:helix-turn-helix transcriptional regulator n=1 Tax=Curtobacterium sp. VKM Ac-2922 TaxID=2929475 RepID=UPI001FB2595F|nr:helix-turn-helix transcriptional regulator [Curtobacterium sp. VKM Ac-2922]MCJ1714922.1 helix-turn-helix transcriptional regulator [Curtobacterium sp. VKM Ac-2922]